MRWMAFGLLTASLVGSALIACSAPEPRSRQPACEEGDDGCARSSKPKKRASPSASDLGFPEALPEDQEEPPPTMPTSAPIQRDAGATPREDDDAGADAGPGPVDTNPPPVLSAANACWSGTLQAWVELNGCYQRKSDGMWFQCGFDTASQSNLWFRNVVDGVGRFGPCTSQHPLP